MGPDWLVTPVALPATLSHPDNCTAILSNGLISRTFSIPSNDCAWPNWATIGLEDALLREGGLGRPVLAALDVEAKVELDGTTYWVGGWNQTCPLWEPNVYNPEPEALFSTCTYFNASQPSNLQPLPNATAFQYVSHSNGPIRALFNYTAARHSSKSAPWPPLGIHLAIKFRAPGAAPSFFQTWIAIGKPYRPYDQ